MFWNYVKANKQNSGFPKTMYYNDVEAHSSFDIADLFASYFQSVFSHPDPDVNFCDTYYCDTALDLNFIHITYDDILKKVQSFNNSSHPGPDGVPAIFVKKCLLSLINPLQIMFNKSLSLSVFPDFWKKSFVLPIFKSGSRNIISNYRGVSKLPFIPKIFDAIVADILFASVKETIITEQHGFFSGRSTTTNLFLFTEFVTNMNELGSEVDCIFTDISKAFDSVNIKHLLNKLKHFGIFDPLLGWIECYLTNRKSHVEFNGILSKSIDACSGVPQGSHLGPILFLLYVNDVKYVFQNSLFLLYADDLKLFRAINSPFDCILLQNDLDKFKMWCSDNSLKLNVHKCKSMRFSKKIVKVPEFNYNISDVVVEQVAYFCDLGVMLDPKLAFTLHVDKIVNKINKTLGFVLRQCQEFTSLRVFCILYNSYVRSLLEYCCIIWSPYYQLYISRLEKIQRKFIKFLCFKLNVIFDKNNYELIVKYFGLSFLISRRHYFDLCFVFNVLNNRVNCSDILNLFSLHVPNRATRGSHLLQVPFHRTLYAQKSPLCRMAKLAMEYNDLNFCGVSINVFKRELKNALNM